MKIEIEIFSDQAADFVKSWLEEHRDLVLASMSNPRELEDGVGLLRAMDRIIAYVTETA